MRSKEFTLTHLLIIVSILAVLIAVAIPILTDKVSDPMTKARGLEGMTILESPR